MSEMCIYKPTDDQQVFVSEISALAPKSSDLEAKLAPFHVADSPNRLHGAYLILAFAISRNDHIVYPAILRRDLFDFLGGRDALLHYWSDPESSFSTAWQRAVEIGLLTKVANDPDDELGYVVAMELGRTR
jgi:hypothetical protein